MTRIPSPYGRKLTPAQMRRMQQMQPYGQIDPLTAAYLQQNQQATREGEERYLDTLGGRQGLRDRVTGDLANYGKSFIDDANRNARTSLNNQLSDLSDRGLAGSSIRSSVTNASNRERNAELARINDAIINRRVNADTNLSDQLYGLMERRTDVQPDPNMLAQLSQGLGQAGYGGGSPYGGLSIGGGGMRGYGGRTAGDYYANPGQYQAGLRPSNFPAPGQNAIPLGGSMNTGPGSYGGGARPSPYQQPRTIGGFDDPTSSAIARYDNRQQQNYLQPQAGFGSPYGYDPSPYQQFQQQQRHQEFLVRQQAQRDAGAMINQQRQGAAPTQPAWRDVANQYAAQPYRAPAGADQFYSRPGYEVYNAENTLKLGGDPSRFAGTRVVSGAPPAGTRIVPGNPTTGYQYGYGSYEPYQQMPNYQPPANQVPQPAAAAGQWNTFGGQAPMRQQQSPYVANQQVPYMAPSIWDTFGGRAPMRTPYVGDIVPRYGNYV